MVPDRPDALDATHVSHLPLLLRPDRSQLHVAGHRRTAAATAARATAGQCDVYFSRPRHAPERGRQTEARSHHGGQPVWSEE